MTIGIKCRRNAASRSFRRLHSSRAHHISYYYSSISRICFIFPHSHLQNGQKCGQRGEKGKFFVRSLRPSSARPPTMYRSLRPSTVHSVHRPLTEHGKFLTRQKNFSTIPVPRRPHTSYNGLILPSSAFPPTFAVLLRSVTFSRT